MPAPTPRMMRICAARLYSWPVSRSGLRLLRPDEPFADLAQRYGQRLLLDPGLDERSHVFQQALAELGVVGIDLPGPLGRHDHEAVLAVHHFEEIIDGRVDDAFPGRSACHVVPFMYFRARQRGPRSEERPVEEE